MVALTVMVALAGCGRDGAPRSAATISPASRSEAARPADVVLWIGDSYTAGVGATPSTSESCLTSDALHLVCALDAEGATGFLADGHQASPTFTPLIGRLEEDRREYSPADVVVDAGRNDQGLPLRDVEAAAGIYLKQLRADFPDAKVAIIAPYYMTSTSEPCGTAFVRFLRTQATMLGFAGVIDPIAEGWISPTTSGRLTIADHVHPDRAGHRYLAEHLAPDLRALGL